MVHSPPPTPPTRPQQNKIHYNLMVIQRNEIYFTCCIPDLHENGIHQMPVKPLHLSFLTTFLHNVGRSPGNDDDIRHLRSSHISQKKPCENHFASFEEEDMLR